MIEIRVTKQLPALTIDAAIAAGPGVTALFGRSGAGKSSIVNMVAGLETPDRGVIRVGERTLFDSDAGIDLAPEERRVGYVFQDARLFPHMSVERNLRYGLKRLAHDRRAEMFERMVTLLGLGPLLDRHPARLSGGEKQRVAIARALLSDPEIVLMDEPLASLDAERKSEVLPYIEALSEDLGIPVIYVSHAVEEVVRLAETLVLVSDGKTVAAGSVEDIMGRIDLAPLTGRYEAGAVLPATIQSHLPDCALTALNVGGHRVLVPIAELAEGSTIRLRVRARDVALATEAPSGTSILNQLPGQVREIHVGDGPYAEVALDIDTEESSPLTLIARITRKSLFDMGLREGSPVVALIKAVAIDRHSLGGHGTGTQRR